MAKETTSVIEEEATELSLSDIYQQLVAVGELILTIPAEEEQPLRKGLAMVKSKQNTKLKDAGIVPDKQTLKYIVTSHKENGKVVEGVVDVHVTLADRTGITVFKMQVPDPTI